MLLPRAARSGHDDVEPTERGTVGRAGGHPVGDDGAVEAQLVLQQFGEQVVVVGHRRGLDPVVDLVVGRHDRPGLALAHRVLERGEVDLAQRLRVDGGDVFGAVGLGVVGDEVLHARGDALVLDAADHLRADERGEVRVLRVALEVPAAHRGALDVDLGGEHDVDAVSACLSGERAPDGERGVEVPGGAHGARRGEQRGGLAGDLAEPAHADRAVRHGDRTQSDAGELVQPPDRLAGQQAHLLVEGEEREELPDVAVALERGCGGLAHGGAPRR